MNLTRFICISSYSTTATTIWVQLATPFMYFVFLGLIWVGVRIYRTYWRAGHAAQFIGTNDFDSDTSIANCKNNNDMEMMLGGHSGKDSKARSSLYDRLINSGSSERFDDKENNNNNNKSDDDNINNTDHDHNSNNAQMLRRRYRFLRAFEMLLLFSYETLIDQALQLVNCMSAGGCGSVLAEFPDIACDATDSTYGPLRAVAILLLIYAVMFPIVLFVALYKIKNYNKKQQQSNVDTGAHGVTAGELSSPTSSSSSSSSSSSPTFSSSSSSAAPFSLVPADTPDDKQELLFAVKFGVFYDHFKPKYFWWEVQVRGF